MKNLIKLVGVLLIGSQSIAAQINVKIGTEGLFHPWNFCMDQNGAVSSTCTQADIDNGTLSLAGFDIDYGNALCAKMSEVDPVNTYNCTWVVKPWGADLAQGLTLGTDYDIIIAQMTAKDDRKSFADFIGPYMFGPEVKYISLVATSVTMGGATKTTPRMGAAGVLLDCPTDTSLKIGTQVSTTHFAHAESLCLNPLTTYATKAEVDAALVNGDVDLIISLTSATKSLLEGSSPVAVSHGDSLMYPGSSAPSIAFDKHNLFADSLKPVVTDAMFSLFATGVVRQLQDLWE